VWQQQQLALADDINPYPALGCTWSCKKGGEKQVIALAKSEGTKE
jgi:hypothetical protein